MQGLCGGGGARRRMKLQEELDIERQLRRDADISMAAREAVLVSARAAGEAALAVRVAEVACTGTARVAATIVSLEAAAFAVQMKHLAQDVLHELQRRTRESCLQATLVAAQASSAAFRAQTGSIAHYEGIKHRRGCSQIGPITALGVSIN